MIKVPSRGPTSADIMIVGEAPGETEEKQLAPFVGASGQEFERILHDAGIDMDKCYITNVCKYRPPKNDISNFFYNKTQAKKEGLSELFGLYPNQLIREGLTELTEEINNVQPKIIISAGNTALWALRGENGGNGYAPAGVTKWRGSQLYTRNIMDKQYQFVPIIHPASILRNWSDRFWTVHDLKHRVVRPWEEPKFDFTIRPGYQQTITFLKEILAKCDSGTELRLAVDLETRKGHIACCGIGWSKVSAFCIPFMCVERPEGYWTLEEETQIILLLRKIFTHPKAYIVGQNYDYDRQYIARYWGVKSNLSLDTMIAHHTMWPGSPKGLDFLSSLYCRHHVYWKDESKEWENEEEETLWIYNCKDCCATWEVSIELEKDLDRNHMWEQYDFQGRKLPDVVLSAVLRGINYDYKARTAMIGPLLEMLEDRAIWFEKVVGFNVESKSKKPWYNSPQQTMTFFYDVMKIKPVFKVTKGKRTRTVDDAALTTIAKREPIVRDICRTLQEYRSLQQFYKVYLTMAIDADGRIRCQLKITGTETFRFASSSDAFGYGGNLQNLSSGNEEKV